MRRYTIRPEQGPRSSHAWADDFRVAQRMRKELETATGIKWRITKKEIAYDNSV